MSKTLHRLFVVALLSWAMMGSAQARIYIRIDQPSEQKFGIAVTSLAGGGSSGEVARELEALLNKNLEIAGFFNLLPRSAFLPDPTPSALTEADIDFSVWQAIGTQGLIKGKIDASGKNVTVQWFLYDVDTKKQLVGKEYSFNRADGYKAVHKFANEVVMALTGSRGIFETQLVAACGPSNKRQIVAMHPDGTGRRQITSNKTNNLSPDWSPDNSQIAFTSFTDLKKGRKHPDLYVVGAGGGKPKLIYNRGSLSITPAFSPSGGTIAFTNTVSEDPEIYTIDTNGNLLGRVTNSWTIDVSPTWSPDGSQMIFASERAGRLHLFKSSAGGGGATRLTFVGYQNDQPAWAPTGDKVAFTSRDRGRFDIFIMNPDGSKIQRLTNQQGDNESPSWSPDGRYVAFSSTRFGKSQIFVMDWEGDNPVAVSNEVCANPDWSGWEATGDAR